MVPAAASPPRQPTWTSLTMRRYWLFDPTQVWSVMLGRLWAAQAHDAAVVGAVTRHQITLYRWTEPPPSAYQTAMPFRNRPRT
jgi:hypothetical protein